MSDITGLLVVAPSCVGVNDPFPVATEAQRRTKAENRKRKIR